MRLMSASSKRLVTASCVVALGVASYSIWVHAQGEIQPVPRQHVLLSIGPGNYEGPIHIRVGDMLQVDPFTFPVVPEYLDSQLKVDLEGDRVLDPIGQRASSGPKEGRASRSI